MSAAGEVQAPGDWTRQYDLAMETIGWALEQAGSSVDDVVRRRTFTVQGARQNRAYGQGPAPFAKSHPTSLGCRISGLARTAGAGRGDRGDGRQGRRGRITWIGPDPIDPLDTA